MISKKMIAIHPPNEMPIYSQLKHFVQVSISL